MNAIYSNAQGSFEFGTIVSNTVSCMSPKLNFEVKFIRRQMNMVFSYLIRVAISSDSYLSFELISLCIWEHFN